MSFRNKTSSVVPGFTLVEVLLSLAIIGIVLTPIFVSQSGVSRLVAQGRRAFATLLAAKKLLLETELNLPADAQTYATEKKIDEGVVRYELKKVPESSSLKKFKNVLIETATLPDEKARVKKQEKLVTFLYRPERQ